MARLGDYVKIRTGYAFKSELFTNNGVPVIRIGNLTSEGMIVDENICFDESFWENNPNYRINKNDILIAMSGATVGKCCINNIDGKFLLNQRVAAISCEDYEISRYIYHVLNSEQFKNYVAKNSEGCAQPNISTKQLSEFTLNISDSSNIVETVTILDKIDELIDNRKKQLSKLDKLVKSRFIELFGDLKANNKGWPLVGFNDCADIDTNMIHNFEGYEDFPHIGIDSIEKETGRLVGYRTIAEDGVISGKYLFTAKHIIYSKIRPNLNKVALPNFEGLCSADAYPILVKEDICNREYLGHALRSKYFIDYILTFSNRTNLPKVNKNQVEGFTLPLPPIEVQQQFATFVEQTDKSKLTIQQSLEQLETLKKSLMQQYFG